VSPLAGSVIDGEGHLAEVVLSLQVKQRFGEVCQASAVLHDRASLAVDICHSSENQKNPTRLLGDA
jgi:hypothetical protein